MRTTSVPRWNTGGADLDSVLTDESIVGVGLIVDATADAEAVAEIQDLAHAPVRSVFVGDADTRDADTEASALSALLDEARVGWRFVVLGAESAVGRLRAFVLAAGALESEVILVSSEAPDITANRARDVFCAHCHAITTCRSAVADEIECKGCGSKLLVYYHYSRRHGGYLGYRDDSEEL